MMFEHQTNQYTISTDKLNWILIWHPNGPVYGERKDGTRAKLPNGASSFFSRLYSLTTTLLELKAKDCDGFDDLRGKLNGFTEEMKNINRLEIAKKDIGDECQA